MTMTTETILAPDIDPDLLQKARSGSHQAFSQLVQPFRSQLRRHCYRMTGSVDDADDIVQETLFRAWRGVGAYVGYGSFRAWLYRIATNRTLDLLKSAPRQREMVNTAQEPAWLQPLPSPQEDDDPSAAVERWEQIGLAYVAALQSLPGRQRAALLLCDVLGFSAAEAAEALQGTTASVNSLLQRARANIATVGSKQATAPTDAEQRRLVEQFVEVWRSGDPDALRTLMTETIHITMPPHTCEWSGDISVSDLLFEIAPDRDPGHVRFVFTSANAERGFATYVRPRAGAAFARHCVMFFGAATRHVRKITGFTEDRIFDLLELPVTIDASD